eukprot:1108952-Amphidinium_carterae.1
MTHKRLLSKTLTLTTKSSSRPIKQWRYIGRAGLSKLTPSTYRTSELHKLLSPPTPTGDIWHNIRKTMTIIETNKIQAKLKESHTGTIDLKRNDFQITDIPAQHVPSIPRNCEACVLKYPWKQLLRNIVWLSKIVAIHKVKPDCPHLGEE